MSPAELYLGPPPESDVAGTEPRYHVRLPVFDGPMELLLHLIRTNEVDIYDIPIAEITQQYLETLELMQELNLNVAGEFVFMAATLIHIKSRMLLPPPHEDGTEEEGLEDPRAELVARLLEYKRYKEAAQLLHQKETVRAAMWLRPESALARLLPLEGNGREELVEVDLFELISAFRTVMERVRQRKDFVVERYAISVEEMIRRLNDRIAPGSRISLEELFEGAATRQLLIVTLLALLEMVRVGVLRLFQLRPFGTIHVVRLEAGAQTGKP
ncbi:MAG: segregation and condensation protein A [Acidobacteriota bacterium]